jgi:hypothetical protein
MDRLDKKIAIVTVGASVNGPWCLAMIRQARATHRSRDDACQGSHYCGRLLAEGYADIYAQWGDTGRALDWFETAMRNRDPYLAYTKTSPFFDPLHNEPRYRAILQTLKFPD